MSRLEGVGNTTGGVQTLPSMRNRATAYGGGVEGREVDTKGECGAKWMVSAVMVEGVEQGGAKPAATGAEQGSGELAVIQRGATGRRHAVALCRRIVHEHGFGGGRGRAKLPQYPSTHQIN